MFEPLRGQNELFDFSILYAKVSFFFNGSNNLLVATHQGDPISQKVLTAWMTISHPKEGAQEALL